jgi:uncharacterized protein
VRDESARFGGEPAAGTSVQLRIAGFGRSHYKWKKVPDGSMKELVEEIARALVDHPEDVRVTMLRSSNVSLIELRTHPTDLGKVIGRQGRTINAIRTLLVAAGAKLKTRFSLEVIEERPGTSQE